MIALFCFFLILLVSPFKPKRPSQRQLVVAKPRAEPVKGAPNVVGSPVIVGRPLWVVGHGDALCDVGTVTDGFEGVVPGRGDSVMRGADGLGVSATDGGLSPPPPISVDPSGEVMPSGGLGEMLVPVCAWTEPQKRTAIATSARRVIVGSTSFHIGLVIRRPRPRASAPRQRRPRLVTACTAPW
jgi:hypothetical protein